MTTLMNVNLDPWKHNENILDDNDTTGYPIIVSNLIYILKGCLQDKILAASLVSAYVQWSYQVYLEEAKRPLRY